MAHRYGVSVATVSDVLVTWVNYLYIMLGSLPIWVSKNKSRIIYLRDLKASIKISEGFLTAQK